MPGATPNPQLQRHFVTVHGQFGPRQVHYRRGGQGPAVLLLHQSPQSSREMEPLIAAWGDRFTLVAPDTPGYGCSQPLRRAGRPLGSASIDDFATATLEFADAVGLGRFGIYGYHTGASIGVALAEAAPGRVAAVAANGLVIPGEEELKVILRDYLPPLVPRWDGSHLAWLWARLREQTIFFPWHDRRAAARLDFDVPPADRLHASLLEFLAAGDHYQLAYAAAFDGHAERRLPALAVPLLVTAAARDPLAGHLDRIGARSASVTVAPATDAADAVLRARTHLLRFPGHAAGPPAGGGPAESPASEYLGAPGRQVRVVRTAARPAGGERAVLLLHAAGSSAAALAPLAATLAAHASVLAADLPGHGASDPLPAATGGAALAGTVAQLAAALLPAVSSPAASGNLTVVSIGSSAPVACEFAQHLNGREPAAARVVLLGPPVWSAADGEAWLAHGLPALTPVWHGGHLLEAWHMVRDGRLFTPWFRRERAGVRHDEPDLDERRIQRDVTDLLRANGSWQALVRDGIRYGSLTGAGLKLTRLDRAPANWANVLA